MAELVLKNLRKDFGKVRAVNDLSLEVQDGEFMVILGPSGAGKTTTLKLIAGVVTPTDGRIYIGGKLMNPIEPHRRNVAMAFESYALYPHFKVYDNLAFPLRAPGSKLSSSEVDQRVKHIAELLNIDMLLDRLPHMLSNGQKQRVAVGRALVREPDVLLLDEPISHLDAKLRHRMRTEFKALESAIQTTTLYVTHDYLEALSLADRLAVINAGKLIQLGEPSYIFNNPCNLFVAQALGHPKINLIECTLNQADDQLQMVSRNGAVCVNASGKLREALLKANLSKVLMGIRPMHMSVANGHTPEQNVFDATVYVHERLGTSGVLTADIGDKVVNVLVPIEMSFSIDERVHIVVEPEAVMAFDPVTEKNILVDN